MPYSTDSFPAHCFKGVQQRPHSVVHEEEDGFNAYFFDVDEFGGIADSYALGFFIDHFDPSEFLEPHRPSLLTRVVRAIGHEPNAWNRFCKSPYVENPDLFLGNYWKTPDRVLSTHFARLGINEDIVIDALAYAIGTTTDLETKILMLSRLGYNDAKRQEIAFSATMRAMREAASRPIEKDDLFTLGQIVAVCKKDIPGSFTDAKWDAYRAYAAVFLAKASVMLDTGDLIEPIEEIIEHACRDRSGELSPERARIIMDEVQQGIAAVPRFYGSEQVEPGQLTFAQNENARLGRLERWFKVTFQHAPEPASMGLS